MLTKRMSTIAIVIAVAAVAVVTASFAVAPRSAQPADDFALRHPNFVPGSQASGIVASDYFQRHPELWSVVDTSDYFLRHPELQTGIGDPSDYFLRHPELIGK